jgi:sugar (pentulose or hexulose) kinase
MQVSAVFDIGKTNKKFFLFDQNYREVYKEYIQFDPINDDNGDDCENLEAIEKWMKSLFQKVCKKKSFDIQTLNFSAYGASLVHIGADGKPVAPLYNYLKPIPEEFFNSFYEKYGGRLKICRQTASPALGFLNSGLQLYWLKQQKPEVFKEIRWSLHLPQYLSYLFTGEPVSDYTSIGCHTTLWDFEKHDYHDWVCQEGLNRLLPPVVRTDYFVEKKIHHRSIKVGAGIHDSSAALLPYIRSDHKPFLLISTGTWSIALNGFSSDHLSDQDLVNDCLNYMRPNGDPVRACRLFLGKEYRTQVQHLHEHFNKVYGYHRNIKFNEAIYQKQVASYKRYFQFEHITLGRSINHDGYQVLNSFEEALHQLLLELVELQVQCIIRAIGNTKLKKIYIDGGFADNDLYVNMLHRHFPDFKLRTTKSPLGSALGAAIAITKPDLNKKFLKKKYAMKKLV